MVIFAGNGEYPKMVIAIRNHEDAFYQTARAHYLAQKYQIPVILLTDQYLADGAATVKPFDLNRVKPVIAGDSLQDALAYRENYSPGSVKSGEITEEKLHKNEYKRYRNTDSGISPRLLPGNPQVFVSADTDEHDEYGFITEAADVRVQQMDKRERKMTSLRQADLQEPDKIGADEPEITLVAWGSLDGAVREAVQELILEHGLAVGGLIFGDVWPLPEERICQARSASRILINVEQNFSGQLAKLIRRETGVKMDASLLRYDGRPISSDEIVEFVLKHQKG